MYQKSVISKMKLNARKAAKSDKTPYTEFWQNSDLVFHQVFVLNQSGVSKPLSNDLLKSFLLKNLRIRHCNGFTLQKRIKISKMIKNISMSDNSARNIVCHIWDLLHKRIDSLLLNLNSIILNLAKPRLFYSGCSLQNTIKTPRKSVNKVTQDTRQKQKSTYLIF